LQGHFYCFKFEHPDPMETFDLNIKNEPYKVSKNEKENSYSVFNHSTFHVIKKNDFGLWHSVEHRFGKELIPVDEIGDAIDEHYNFMAYLGTFKHG
jgi:hypothetical protein